MFKPNFRVIEELQHVPGMTALKKAAAEEVKSKAEAFMPRGHGHPHMADRFVVEEQDGDVSIGNLDAFFFLAEFGSVNNPSYAPLRRAVRASGLHLKEDPKP